MHVFVLESVRDFYNFRVYHAQFYVNGNTAESYQFWDDHMTKHAVCIVRL